LPIVISTLHSKFYVCGELLLSVVIDELMVRFSLRIYVVVLFAVVLLFQGLLYTILNSSEFLAPKQIEKVSLKGSQIISHPKSNRVAILIPYIGPTLPSWFSSFMYSAQFSSELIDWFMFVNVRRNISCPHNVKFIFLDEIEILSRIAKMDPIASINDESERYWTAELKKVLNIHPYLLVEFKPCLGWIFQVVLSPHDEILLG
jgi:hypothetical protein